MELQDFLTIIKDTCDDLLVKVRQTETHSKIEQDILGAIKQSILHIRIVKDIGDKALINNKK